MVLPGLPAGGDAGITPTADPGHGTGRLTRVVGVSPRLLAPNERLSGTAEAASLLARLADLRGGGGVDVLIKAHPSVIFLPLDQALRRWESAGLVLRPFKEGLNLLRTRYANLGLLQLLPLDRILVGVHSSQSGTFGGFHHPGQGYRHLQMRALITTYGDLARGSPADPDLTALDLLRAYAHDCLHYGSHRSYRLRGDEVVRTQYGVNFRRHDGRTYSAPDLAGSPTTRNLGIVMEGACDREARAITRIMADRCRIAEPEDFNRLAFRDMTGTLEADDVDELADATARDALTPSASAAAFLEAMGRYQRGVNARYGMFLDEIGRTEAEELHTVVLVAALSGALSELCAWLDRRHGPRAFAALFLSPAYFGQVHRQPWRCSSVEGGVSASRRTTPSRG